MIKSKISTAVTSNIKQPKTRDDIWWLAVGVFISRLKVVTNEGV